MTTNASRVLVASASKHGATAQIAERIGQKLRDHGCDVTVADAGRVDTVDGYDAVVMGSAVYAGHWLDDAKSLADRVASQRPRPAVWLFSSGPVGDPPKPEEDPVDVAAIAEATSPNDHQVFAGKIDKAKLGFAERAIMIAVRAPEGDFRDWAAIDSWAGEIADALRPAQNRATPGS
ncbi:MAG TPA: flavodoxin domain-containing protein [Euzebyales bacterium]